MSQETETQVEDDQDIEQVEIKTHPFKRFIDHVFLPVGVAIISLGSFSEAFILVGDFTDMVISKFSNTVEYEKIERINVGNTQSYVENIMGAAAVEKDIGSEVKAKYYFNEKFLLTTYYKGERVSAYTIVALTDGFAPDLPWSEEHDLNDITMLQNTDVPSAFSFDSANTNRFFLESAAIELKGLFQSAYIGSVEYGNGEFKTDALDALYKAEVFGSGNSEQLIADYRTVAVPNFFGEGELEIEIIQKGLLSNGEYLNFFGKD